MQTLMRPTGPSGDDFILSAQYNADAPRLFCDSTFLKEVESTDDC